MFDPVGPYGRQPTRLHRPWDSPGKNTGGDCHFLLQCVKVKLLSCVWFLVTPWTAAHQLPPSMGFSRQEYWGGVPLPSPLVPWPGAKTRPPVLGAWSLGHWTTRKVPCYFKYPYFIFILKSTEKRKWSWRIWVIRISRHDSHFFFHFCNLKK